MVFGSPGRTRPDEQTSARREAAEITPRELRLYGYTPLVYPYGAPLALDTREPLGAATASGLTFLAGLWLVLAPFALGYDTAPQARWNDVVIGGVIAVLAIVRTFAPMRVAWFSIVNLALGIWLVIAPLTLGYSRPEATPEAVINDLVVGAVVVAMASLSAASTYRRREDEAGEREEEPDEPR
ncbi:SPW repeat protein [Lentzea albidocapillata]|uniref:SPW repeat-containing protein n=1 Tax=Lentzea albidocapillata TaxID=40571 RepID=A0A1W2FRS2_9PSEU|nr:SPW repeat protein [Lentzea albidocapillata]SMD24667.1 SPW repeat-containing protein [Lentzea albidocapillata]